jgi:hypothetical protein
VTGSPKLPDALRRVVAADLTHVHPLASPARRALAVAVWTPLALVAIAALGVRADAGILGWGLTWGAALLGNAAGLILVGLALAAAVPGRGVSREVALAATAATALAAGANGWLARNASEGLSVANMRRSVGPACFLLTALLGLSALGIVGALVVRAAPLRARLAGFLGGAGAGLMAESAYHVHCPITDARHLLVWHTGAVAAVVLAGFAAGSAWERREAKRMVARRTRRPSAAG